MSGDPMGVHARFENRRAGLSRMRAVALGVLIALAVVFVVAVALEGRAPWLRFVRAAAEGGMVGALADWFAVTVLFRRPLGLPIPHTAIIPRRKDQLGEAIGVFVRTQFLDDANVDDAVSRLRVAGPVGVWLASPGVAASVARDLASAARYGLAEVDDARVSGLLTDLAREHMLAPEWSGTLGELLGRLVEQGAERGLIDIVVVRAHEWAREHPEFVTALVAERTPAWLPRSVDDLIAQRLHRELLAYLAAVRDDPAHTSRVAVAAWLERLAEQMRDDPDTVARVEALKERVVGDPDVRRVVGEVWIGARSAIDEQLDSASSPLSRALEGAVAGLAERLQRDAALAGRIDEVARRAGRTLALRHRDAAAAFLTRTVEGWNGEETADRIELLVGRDLQFIRINGSVVGALAGLVIALVGAFAITPLTGG